MAIVALLAAIQFPVLGRAGVSARRANYLSNLKQLSIASLQYVQDNHERLFGRYTNFEGQGRRFWDYRPMPYVKSINVFYCPSEHIVANGTNSAFLDGHAKWFSHPGVLTNNLKLWDRE